MTGSTHKPSLETALKWLWYGLLLFRFLVPVYDSPLLHLFSDPARHWENGLKLLDPTFMGSVDPKLYQLYVYLLHELSNGKSEVVAAFTGLLCVAMAVVWYRVCAELFRPIPARILGCLIAICPSFTALYTLFMNETLLLVLMGAALWLSLRAIRVKSLPCALLAVIFWVLTCYTRSLMLPMAFAVIWYLALKLSTYRWRIAAFAAFSTMLLALPAGWHSWQRLQVFAPFGFATMNEFYYFTGSRTFEVNTPYGVYGFSSPSFYYPVGMPFFEYNSCRANNKVSATIDTARGMEDWETALNAVKKNYSPTAFWCGITDNLIFLFMANSWPDSAVEWGYSWIYFFNFHLRWMWLPLMLLLVSRAPVARRTEAEQLILCCALGLLLILAFQMFGVNEGRYRKPLEILLIPCAYILTRKNTSKDGGITMWQFMWQCYLRPCTRLTGLRRKEGAI